MARISFISRVGNWLAVKKACYNTVGLDATDKEPTDKWKKNLLLSEHSPIRKMHFSWKWVDLPYWVSTHFVRHKFGIDHWIETQREDRTGEDRHTKPQGAPVKHEVDATAQALINVSRKRCCRCASPETVDAWQLVIDHVERVDPIMASVMVAECVYRGFCPEMKSCGHYKTGEYQQELQAYRSGINGN